MDIDNESVSYKEKCQELFPSVDKEIKDPVVDIFVESLNAFEKVFNENEYFKYLAEKPEGVDKALYLSKVPNGVNAFEQWVQIGLHDLTKDIVDDLKKLSPVNIGLIYFAQLLDDQDFEKYFENAKVPKDKQSDFKTSCETIISVTELALIAQAVGCLSIGLFNSSAALMTTFLQKSLFENEDFYKIISDAKSIETENKKATKDSLASNNIKHDKSRVVEDYTIKKFVSLPNHLMMKPIDIIDLIVDDVIKFSLTSQDVKNASGYFQFYDEIKYPKRPLERPRANIRKWISAYKKSLTIKN